MEISQADREREGAVRRRIIRTAVLATPVFVAIAGAWFFFLWDRLTGPNYGSTWFLMVVITIFAALFGVQSISALRDLFGKPHEQTAQVTRKWSKRDSFVWKSYYIRVERKILRGDRDVLEDVRAGDMVEIRYYPHSAIVTALRKLERPAEPEPEPVEVEEDLPREPIKPRGRAARPEF